MASKAWTRVLAATLSQLRRKKKARPTGYKPHHYHGATLGSPLEQEKKAAIAAYKREYLNLAGRQLEFDTDVTRFIPFNPDDKMTQAYVGDEFVAAKGAPTVMRDLDGLTEEMRQSANDIIAECVPFRSLSLSLAL